MSTDQEVVAVACSREGNRGCRVAPATQQSQRIRSPTAQWRKINAWNPLPVQQTTTSSLTTFAERRVCSVPHQNSTFGDRSFAAAGPRAWNELPFNLRDTALSLTVFNAHLKTHLFPISCGATAHLWHLWFPCAAYKCTYLLTYLWYTVSKTFLTRH